MTNLVLPILILNVLAGTFDVSATETSLPSWASTTPIREPQLFGEGVISTDDDEFGGQFSPDGRTLWFSKSVPRYHLDTIFVSYYRKGVWNKPQIASFSGVWHDYDPTLSADGKRLYFVSDRPRADGKVHSNYDLWYLEATANGWSDPKNLGAPINGDEWGSHFAVTTRDGTLYFTSDRPGSKGFLDVWEARSENGSFQVPTNVGDAINNPKWGTLEVYVDPDKKYMIVSSYGHEDSLGDCDLYVSYRQNEVWQPLQHLAAPVNSAARDYTARVTPDGKYLYFTSERGVPTDERTKPWTYREFTGAVRGVRNGLGNIYRIELDAALPPPKKAPH